MKTYLVFPPHWTATEPYLSCPSLTAFLRKHGLETEQQDANIEFFNYILSEPFLRRARDEVQARFRGLEKKDDLSVEEQDLYGIYTRALLPADTVIDGIEQSMLDFRDRDKFYQLEHYYRANRIQYAALLLASAFYHPSNLSFTEYTSRHRYGSTSEVFEAVEDRGDNMFIDFFESSVLPRIESAGPDLLGLSICSPHQVIPAFTLASMVKKRLPGIHIVAGGGYYTRMLLEPQNLEPIFKVFDSLVVYEGETALLRLAEELDGQRRFERVPNLLYMENGRVRVNEPFHAENIDELPSPTFDGFPLDSYLTSQVVIPCLTSRGCYWGKCAFCTSFETYKGGYRQRKPELVLQDMRTLSKECNSNAFFFVDQATSPAALRRLSQALIDSGEKYYWQTEARFERKLEKPLLEKMHESGCRKLLFGMESGHQRVLDLMQKGNRLEDTRRILEDCVEVGVGVHLFLITGFPTETEEEAQASVDFVTGIKGLMESPGLTYHVHTFGLERDSKVGMHPDRYGVTLHPMDPCLDQCQHHIDYDVDGGMPPDQIQSMKNRMRGEILSRLKFKEYPINGPHNLLYLVHYGREFPDRPWKHGEFSHLSFNDLLEIVPTLCDEVSVKQFKYFVPVKQDGADGDDGKVSPREESTSTLVQVGEQYYCFIGRTESTWLVSPRGKVLLDMVDGTKSINQLCAAFEQQHPSKTSFIGAAKDLKVFLEKGAIRPVEAAS